MPRIVIQLKRAPISLKSIDLMTILGRTAEREQRVCLLCQRMTDLFQKSAEHYRYVNGYYIALIRPPKFFQ